MSHFGKIIFEKSGQSQSSANVAVLSKNQKTNSCLEDQVKRLLQNIKSRMIDISKQFISRNDVNRPIFQILERYGITAADLENTSNVRSLKRAATEKLDSLVNKDSNDQKKSKNHEDVLLPTDVQPKPTVDKPMPFVVDEPVSMAVDVEKNLMIEEQIKDLRSLIRTEWILHEIHHSIKECMKKETQLMTKELAIQNLEKAGEYKDSVSVRGMDLEIILNEMKTDRRAFADKHLEPEKRDKYVNWE